MLASLVLFSAMATALHGHRPGEAIAHRVACPQHISGQYLEVAQNIGGSGGAGGAASATPHIECKTQGACVFQGPQGGAGGAGGSAASSPPRTRGGCTVTDPTGTPLNIRDIHKNIVGSIANGRIVHVIRSGKDDAGKSWVYVASPSGQRLGWVYREFVSCY